MPFSAGKKISVFIGWKYYVLVYENGKMRPIETILRRKGGGIKENDGGREISYNIL
jgi:hypothetical protein